MFVCSPEPLQVQCPHPKCENFKTIGAGTIFGILCGDLKLYLKHFSKAPRHRVSEKTTHLCHKIYRVHSRPITAGRKGFSHQSDNICLNGRHFIFVIFLNMGTWSVSQKRSGFRCFVGITYSATF